LLTDWNTSKWFCVAPSTSEQRHWMAGGWVQKDRWSVCESVINLKIALGIFFFLSTLYTLPVGDKKRENVGAGQDHKTTGSPPLAPSGRRKKATVDTRRPWRHLMATTTLARHLLGGFTCTQKRKKRTRDGNNKSLTISHHFFPSCCVCVEGRQTKGEKTAQSPWQSIYV
jgi:hypothetical protein